MGRLNFDSSGKLQAVDSKLVDKRSKPRFQPITRDSPVENHDLRTSSSLDFLKEETPKVEKIMDDPYWSLFKKGGKELSPLEFSNGKTQRDVVKEVVDHIQHGKKVIFVHGVCGTGKSAIALNISRALGGKASIVVPIKSLQRQYEKDYMEQTFLTKPNGKKMKIAMITGRDNHDSIIEPGKSCADPFLPDTIKITEKNFNKLKDYYLENPFITNNVVPTLKRLKRISIAPTNPHWSPIMPAEIEINVLKDATKKKYMGMFGREFIFYHRKPGCSYYDQYLSYMDSDVIIFNAAKYLTEVSMARKPQTEVDIIDEADEFLDGLSNQINLNLTRLASALRLLVPDSEQAQTSIQKMLKLIDAEETKARALGLKETKVNHISETKLQEMLEVIIDDTELQAEMAIDDMNYSNTALEAAKNFKDSFKDTYLMYRKEEGNLFTELVTTNLSQKFNQLVDGNKALVLMSGTLHSESVLKNIFGIEDFTVVEAETLNQGSIEIHRTGREFDCRYSNFASKNVSRQDYLESLAAAVEKSTKPALVHVNAFADLPSEEERQMMNVSSLMTKDKLRDVQFEDKLGSRVTNFKKGNTDTLFTTKCARGIDFPGDTCRSVIFSKYPNPNVKDIFFTILQKTHPNYYWEFYRDKAWREFLQRVYRAVRSRDDHVYILSPDTRVLDAVRKMQTGEV